MVKKLAEEYKTCDLLINMKNSFSTKLFLLTNIWEQLHITKNGSIESEMKKHIEQEKYSTKQLNDIYWNKEIRPETEIRIHWRGFCGLTLRDKVRNEQWYENDLKYTTIVDTIQANVYGCSATYSNAK